MSDRLCSPGIASSYSLDHSWAKIERARGHLDQLHHQNNALLNRRPCMFTVEEDPKPPSRGAHVYRAHFRDPVGLSKDLIRFGIVAGEITHHLRSSLNHVVHHLVTGNGGQPSTRIEFPIFTERQKYASEVSQKIEGVSARAKTVIERSQPYHRGGGRDPLWTVHEVDRIDKHRVVIVTLVGLFVLIDDQPPPTFRMLNNGAVVQRLWTRDPVGMNANLPVQVALEKIGDEGPRPLVERLAECVETTERVVDQFSEFF